MRSLSRLLTAAAAALLISAPAWAADRIVSPTTGWNELWDDVMLDMLAIGVPFAIVSVYMLIRFRARTPGQVGNRPELSKNAKIAWMLIPAALFVADDFILAAKGWSLWDVQRTVPAGAMEVKVDAQQWSFGFTYDNGVESDDLVIPVGKPVVLRMHSADVIHSFGATDYRVKEDIVPGRETYLWFIADKPNVSKVVCVGYCGMGHSQMNADIRALSQADFDAWLAKEAAKQKKKSASIAAPRKS